jgi:predicted SAM-dependent methyltransferase
LFRGDLAVGVIVQNNAGRGRFVEVSQTNPCYGCLNQPSDQQVVCGTLVAEGWLVDPTGTDRVIELRVDDRPVRATIAPTARPDVKAALVETAKAEHVFGFRATVESAQFSDGEHRLSCVIRKGETTSTIATLSIQVVRCAVSQGPQALLASRFLRGAGLEIGALHSPLPVPSACRVRYVDRHSVDELRREYSELAAVPFVPVDVIDDGEKLNTIAPESQDFVIASHFLEHTQDPIGTIRRHLQVIRPGGILFVAVPDKRFSFDVNRPVTTLEHIYRDYEDGPAWSYLDHVREYAKCWNFFDYPYEEYVRTLVETNYSIHFHVWTQHDFLEMLIDIRRRLALPFDIEAISSNSARGETIAVLRKTSESVASEVVAATETLSPLLGDSVALTAETTIPAWTQCGERLSVDGAAAGLSAKFVAVTRKEGLSAALSRATRKLRKKLSRNPLLSRSINSSGR